MNELKEIIALLIKEIEEKDNIINVSGGRGYGVGKAKVKDYHGVSKNLGIETEKESEEEYVLKPVKISKAFKKG